jgi:hypothetical protein
MNKEKEKLIEELAKLEHEQWESWTKYIANQVLTQGEDFSINEQMLKWQKNWKPYEELTEEEKEKDRKWARKVYDISFEAGKAQAKQEALEKIKEPYPLMVKYGTDEPIAVIKITDLVGIITNL